MDQRIIDLYDKFTHGQLDRRAFLDRLVGLAGGVAAAYALIPLLKNDYALAQTVSPDDARLTIETLTVDAAGTPIKGYLAKPKALAKAPVVIVIHENRGLNPHIQDVARRMALDGFVAFAPDLLTPIGGTPTDEDKAREMIGQLKAEDVAKWNAGLVAALKARPDSSGKVGVVGFCWGGGAVNDLAIAAPDLSAGVAYYGRQGKVDGVPAIRAALLLHYAGIDERINAGIAAYEAALKAAGKTYELHMYDGANHAFNNDTNPARYNKAAADLAWGRTVAFFKKHLA